MNNIDDIRCKVRFYASKFPIESWLFFCNSFPKSRATATRSQLVSVQCSVQNTADIGAVGASGLQLGHVVVMGTFYIPIASEARHMANDTANDNEI